MKNIREQKSVIIPANFNFKNVSGDFEVEIGIFSMTTQNAPETKTKPTGMKLFSSKLGFKRAGSREEKTSAGSVNPALFSPGGPNAVRKSNFRSIGTGKIDMEKAQKFDQFRLASSPWDSIIQSVFAVQIEPKFTKSLEFCSFLTVRKGGDSGYGDWKRLWAVLSRDRITFWKYPEDKDDLPAEGYISLRLIINAEVKSANRALTSRPNSLELYAIPLKEGLSVAPPISVSFFFYFLGQKRNPTHFSGIISDYDPKKYPRYLLSADTSSEKAAWCDYLNKTLENLRTWEKDLPAPQPDSMVD